MANHTLLIVGGTLQQGGAERIISVLSEKFLEYFAEVKIALWREAPVFYTVTEKIEIVSVPKWSGEKSVMRQMVWFRKYVKRLKPDAVLSFLAPFNMLSLVSLAGTGIPVYIASRSDPHYDAPNRWWRWVRDGIYHLADGISVQSDGNKEYFSKYLRKKVSVIYNPVFIRSELVGKALETPKELVIVKQGEKSSVVIGGFSGDSSALSGLSVGDLWGGRLPGGVGEENPGFATRGMRVIARSLC